MKYAAIVVAIALILAGCGNKECSKPADCPRIAYKTVSGCNDGICEYNWVDNYCGNLKCEDGTKGTKDFDEDNCNCPQDCKEKCEGKAVLKEDSRGKAIYTKYVGKFCQTVGTKKTCMEGLNPTDIMPITSVSQKDFSVFSVETSTKLNQPFDIGNETIKFEVRLLDDKPDKLQYPITIRRAQVLQSSILFGEKDNIDSVFNQVGDKVTFEVPLTAMISQMEEEKMLTYKIDIDYFQINSVTKQPEIKRDSYTGDFKQKLLLVKLGE